MIWNPNNSGAMVYDIWSSASTSYYFGKANICRYDRVLKNSKSGLVTRLMEHIKNSYVGSPSTWHLMRYRSWRKLPLQAWRMLPLYTGTVQQAFQFEAACIQRFASRIQQRGCRKGVEREQNRRPFPRFRQKPD
eukprot:9595694-Alexandrium_andersonii.AAC.1